MKNKKNKKNIKYKKYIMKKRKDNIDKNILNFIKNQKYMENEISKIINEHFFEML